jgi:hypothetical protein
LARHTIVKDTKVTRTATDATRDGHFHLATDMQCRGSVAHQKRMIQIKSLTETLSSSLAPMLRKAGAIAAMTTLRHWEPY